MFTSLQAASEGLRTAFPPHPVNADRAFGEPGNTTYLDGDAFKDGVRGLSWDTLDFKFLDFHHDATVFLSPESFIEYLPAFLSAVLGHEPELNGLPTFLRGLLTRTNDAAWFDARIERLTPEQKRAVARALEALEASQMTALDRRDYTAVLDSYWRDLIQESTS